MKAKTYEMICSHCNGKYVGSCTVTLRERLRKHKNFSKSKNASSKLYKHMKEFGADKFSIHLLEDVDCLDKTELRMKEA